MKTESDTPRTDALMPDQVYKRTMYEHILVMESHARQLERELNEVTKQRDKLKRGLLTAAERGIRSNCYDTTVANQLYTWIMDDMRKDAPTELNYYLTQTK